MRPLLTAREEVMTRLAQRCAAEFPTWATPPARGLRHLHVGCATALGQLGSAYRQLQLWLDIAAHHAYLMSVVTSHAHSPALMQCWSESFRTMSCSGPPGADDSHHRSSVTPTIGCTSDGRHTPSAHVCWISWEVKAGTRDPSAAGR